MVSGQRAGKEEGETGGPPYIPAFAQGSMMARLKADG